MTLETSVNNATTETFYVVQNDDSECWEIVRGAPRSAYDALLHGINFFQNEPRWEEIETGMRFTVFGPFVLDAPVTTIITQADLDAADAL